MDTRARAGIAGEGAPPTMSRPMQGDSCRFSDSWNRRTGHLYYRRIYADALLMLEVARRHPLMDPDRLIVTGVSQGGGITLAAAG
jgi:cephalosporin-C deacetylase